MGLFCSGTLNLPLFTSCPDALGGVEAPITAVGMLAAPEPKRDTAVLMVSVRAESSFDQGCTEPMSGSHPLLS